MSSYFHDLRPNTRSVKNLERFNKVPKETNKIKKTKKPKKVNCSLCDNTGLKHIKGQWDVQANGGGMAIIATDCKICHKYMNYSMNHKGRTNNYFVSGPGCTKCDHSHEEPDEWFEY